MNALLREAGRELTSTDTQNLQKWHAGAYEKVVSQMHPLPGAVELLSHLAKAKIPYAIATSGMLESARPSLKALEIGPEVPVITRDQWRHAKPAPYLLLAAAERLGTSIYDSIGEGAGGWALLAARAPRC